MDDCGAELAATGGDPTIPLGIGLALIALGATIAFLVVRRGTRGASTVVLIALALVGAVLFGAGATRAVAATDPCSTASASVTPSTTATAAPTPSPSPTPTAEPAAVGDRVWLDKNRNGLQDADEPGYPGVQLTLLDAGTLTPVTVGAGDVAIDPTVVTDANGHYEWTGLLPGDYVIRFDSIADPAGTQVSTGVNSGLVTTVFRQVLDSSGTVVDDATLTPPDPGCNYGFVRYFPGGGYSTQIVDDQGTVIPAPPQVFVSMSNAASQGATIAHADSNPALDSDFDPVARTASVSLAAGETDNTIDLGLLLPQEGGGANCE